jgi:ribonuclease Y
MNGILYTIIGLLVGVPAGVTIGRFLLRKLFKDQEAAAQNKVKKTNCSKQKRSFYR